MSKRWSRASLLYLIGYLWGGGAALLLAPKLALTLMMSTGDYGEVLPRLLGMMMLLLGTLIAQVVRYRIDVLYKTAVALRLLLCAGLVWLYTLSTDPFFLVLTGIVGVGVALTALGILFDREPSALASGGAA